MQGVKSSYTNDIFNSIQTKGNRYVVAYESIRYYPQFDTLDASGWNIVVEVLPIDSFPNPVIINTVTPR